MRTIDTRGQLCPAPLIAAKKALKETKEGESFILLTDNETSFHNLCRFLKDNNTAYKVTEKDKIWTLVITRSAGDISKAKINEFCDTAIGHFAKGDFVIAISSDRMGTGDDELGHLLMNNFILAIKDLDMLPQKILFYNRGVALAVNDSPVFDHLKDLEKMGVELLICATCVNHYSLDGDIGAGILSNMFSITEAMASAGSVVRP